MTQFPPPALPMLPPVPKAASASSRFRILFWITAIVLFVTFLALVRSILLPFVVGMLAAYFLDPAVRRLRARGWSRGTAAASITVGFFMVTIGIGVLLFPPIVHQLIALIKEIPTYLHQLQAQYGGQVEHYMNRLGNEQVDSIKDSLGSSSGAVMGWAGRVAGGALQSGLAFLDILSLVFITPIVAYYLLRDWHKMVVRFYALLPRDVSPTIQEQLHEIDHTLSGFIRGQTNICVIFAAYYGILLSIVGLNFGLLIGIASGLMLFIPFVGFAICFALSTIVALIQFSDGTHIVAVLAIYGIGLAIENAFLTPRLVGKRVGLHPLWVIFGMLAGGALFGFVGILIAVPLTAVIGVVVRFAIERYLQSSLYTGAPHVSADEARLPPA